MTGAPADRPAPDRPFATLAGCAAEGIFFELICLGCRHSGFVTALTLCQGGHGDRDQDWVRSRAWCRKCGGGRVSVMGHGHWTGPDWSRPEDWAATVDERLPRNRERAP